MGYIATDIHNNKQEMEYFCDKTSSVGYVGLSKYIPVLSK